MREQLIDLLQRELVGPDNINHKLQENGQEILDTSPRERYAAGILFPQKTTADEVNSIPDSENSQMKLDFEESNSEYEFGNGSKDELLSDEIDSVNLANTYMQSALGFSCILNLKNANLDITIKAGSYKKVEDTCLNNEASKRPAFYRSEITEILHIRKEELPTNAQRSIEFPIKDTKLCLKINKRSIENQDQLPAYFTFTLINSNQTNKTIHEDQCYFQVSLNIKSSTNSFCFLPLPNITPSTQHEDEASISFLYRKIRSYAIGHGCSVKWYESAQGCNCIQTETIPLHVVPNIIPGTFDDITLGMLELSYCCKDRSRLNVLDLLCEKYEKWINDQKKAVQTEVNSSDLSKANHHISQCRQTLNRIRKGITLLKENDVCLRAFALMNESMLLQQLHYNLPLRSWRYENGVLGSLEYNIDLYNKETWPGYDVSNKKSTYGLWRPFQIAFILMNLNAFIDPESDERKIADLIWFPTGGGKTEAYLGLTAFVILLRRLRNEADNGTAVIMRYTLRLLTAQQFLRAASLICACDYIREREADLGSNPITIGLWVGQQSAPNKRQEAVQALRKMGQSESLENPFILLKCPWCGAQMGLVKGQKRYQVYGYYHQLNPSTVRFKCPDSNCTFSRSDNLLPLFVIDEDIYESPPSLLIGTVDKFAMLVWRPEARSFFGIRQNDKPVKPPELIIQDELHLISSALGSIVGHYETMIQALATENLVDKKISAKIIASTATITRAKEQISSLYGIEPKNICIFPPQGIAIEDSFFSQFDSTTPGRMYVGVFPAGLVSKISAQVRIVAALLQGVEDIQVNNENERDPYWTLIEYFNSLRELGTAATLTTSYVRDYLKRIYLRKRNKNPDKNQTIKIRNKTNSIELTSRIPGNKIPSLLQKLENSYPNQEFSKMPVDICLATSMISVGLDVSRLGLMVVMGQPKLTSEYIQTTSRIGRKAEAPGLIITLYNPFRSRDRSYYEQFHQYHNRLYQYVEPSSVTPFAAPVREKALHAVIVGLVRYLGSITNSNFPKPLPTEALFHTIREIILKRVQIVQNDEYDETKLLLNKKIDEWKNFFPPIYGNFINREQEQCLIYPAGTTQNEEIAERGWPTLTSMRDVDKSCDLRVLSRNYSELESEE